MTKTEYITKLKKLHACESALEWSIKTDGTPQELWEKCERGDWLLWLIGEVIDRDDEAQLRRLTLAKAKCAKLVVHLMKDKRSIKAVEVAEEYGKGEATREELDAAAAAAAAADAAAASYAAADAARNDMLKKCAAAVREVYPVNLLERRPGVSEKEFDITKATGFFDAVCQACGNRYGWYGTIKSRPDCPHCKAIVTPTRKEAENEN